MFTSYRTTPTTEDPLSHPGQNDDPAFTSYVDKRCFKHAPKPRPLQTFPSSWGACDHSQATPVNQFTCVATVAEAPTTRTTVQTQRILAQPGSQLPSSVQNLVSFFNNLIQPGIDSDNFLSDDQDEATDEQIQTPAGEIEDPLTGTIHQSAEEYLNDLRAQDAKAFDKKGGKQVYTRPASKPSFRPYALSDVSAWGPPPSSIEPFPELYQSDSPDIYPEPSTKPRDFSDLDWQQLEETYFQSEPRYSPVIRSPQASFDQQGFSEFEWEHITRSVQDVFPPLDRSSADIDTSQYPSCFSLDPEASDANIITSAEIYEEAFVFLAETRERVGEWLQKTFFEETPEMWSEGQRASSDPGLDSLSHTPESSQVLVSGRESSVVLGRSETKAGTEEILLSHLSRNVLSQLRPASAPLSAQVGLNSTTFQNIPIAMGPTISQALYGSAFEDPRPAPSPPAPPHHWLLQAFRFDDLGSRGTTSPEIATRAHAENKCNSGVEAIQSVDSNLNCITPCPSSSLPDQVVSAFSDYSSEASTYNEPTSPGPISLPSWYLQDHAAAPFTLSPPLRAVHDDETTTDLIDNPANHFSAQLDNHSSWLRDRLASWKGLHSQVNRNSEFRDKWEVMMEMEKADGLIA